MAKSAKVVLQNLAIFVCLAGISGLRPDPFKLEFKSLNTDAILSTTGNFKGIFNTLCESFITVKESTNNGTVSFKCMNDTEKLIADLTKTDREDYAVRFLDADAKIPYGIKQGQLFWVGDYHECLNITSTYNDHTKHSFKGKYFSARTSSIIIGFCLPDSCDKQDAKALVSTITDGIQYVYTSDGKSPDAGDIVGIVICCLILVVVIIGTAVDYFSSTFYKNEKVAINGYTKIDNQDEERTGLLSDKSMMEEKPSQPSVIIKVLKTFSFFSNTTRLMSTKTAQGPLACLNGLRVISMFWVIQGHTYGFAIMALKDIMYAETLLPSRFSFQAILNGTYSVDSFFFLSGLLVAYLALRELSEKRRINWIYYFAHRYWRLTPIYAICLMFFTTVYTLLITGPFQWIGLDPSGPLYNSTEDCRIHWWSNLLYINNLYPHYGGEDNCFGWAWYLANDMQFYVFLSPIVIILLHKFKLIGIITSLFLIIGGIISRLVTAEYYGMNENGDITKHQNEPWAKGGPLYTKPYARWSVYIVGMLTGYILHKTRCTMRMNKIVVILGWCTSIAMGMSVVYGLYYYNHNPGTVMPKAGAIMYISCARTAWGLALAWLTIACATGYGGWVNTFLAWKVWAPLGRLTYAAYLVHPMVLFGYYLNAVAPIQFTDLEFIYIFVANLVFSYGIAYVVSMAIEAPMMQLEKLLLNRK